MRNFLMALVVMSTASLTFAQDSHQAAPTVDAKHEAAKEECLKTNPSLAQETEKAALEKCIKEALATHKKKVGMKK